MDRHYIFSFLPAVSVFFIGVMSLCLPIEGQMPQGLKRCGFPGLPARGNISLYKDVYDIGERIQYTCSKGSPILGPEVNICKDSAKWSILKPPLCRINYAYDSSTTFSKESPNFPSSLAVDELLDTCSEISSNSLNEKWWKVDLKERIEVRQMYIRANARNHAFNLTIILHDAAFQSKPLQDTVCTNINRNSDTTLLSEFLNCTGMATSVKIVDNRRIGLLNLCEVQVFSKPGIECGEPDREPYCQVTKIDDYPQTVKYSAKEGYYMVTIDDTRVCTEGTWRGPIANCYRLDEVDNSKNQRSNFVIGVAIGVTAASISTIVVIVVVVIVMKKYYRHNSNQSPTVSDGDAVFLRGNPTSTGSTSPTIQPLYSNPWDDPAFHMYEYIDNIPPRHKTTTLKRGQKPSVEDGYLSPRSSDSRSWTNSGGRSTGPRKNLLDPPVILREHDGNGNPNGRVSSFNELEVEAYGYPETDDSCRV